MSRAARVRSVLGVLLADARRQRLQTATQLLGLGVGVAVVVAIRLCSQAALESFQETQAGLAGAATHQLVAGGPLPAERLPELLASAGVVAAQPVIEAVLLVPPHGGSGAQALRLVGLDPFLMGPFLPQIEDTPDATEVAWFGEFLTRPGLALLTRADAARLGVADDDALAARGPAGPVDLVCRVFDPKPALPSSLPLAFVDIATAQELLGLGTDVLRFDLVLRDGAGLALRPGERLELPAWRGGRAETLTAAFRGNLLALGFLAVLVGAFLVFNMAQFAVTRRRALLGRLRCLGCPARDLLLAVLCEAALLGAAGGVLGLLGGRLLAEGMVGGVTQTVAMLYGALGEAQARLDPLTAVAALLVAVAAAVAASWAPARSAARTPPVFVAGGTLREPPLPWRVPALLAAAAALSLWPDRGGIAGAAAGVLLLLLATATLAPLLLGLLVRRLPRGLLLSLAAGRIERSLARIGGTAGALVMPLAMTIGIVVMVGSFQRAIVTWADGVLGADVYVKPAFVEVAPQAARLDPELLDALPRLPGVEAVDLLRAAEDPAGIPVAGGRLHALRRKGGLALLDGGSLEAALARVEAGEALVSEPLARHRGLGVGDVLELTGPQGPRPLRVAGVFQDFTYDRGAVLLHEATHLRLYGETGVVSAALLLAPDADARAICDALVARFPDVRAESVGEVRAGILAAFERTFAITYVLQAIATALAIAGLLTGLLCLHLERRAELGVLRALGATGGRVGGLLFLEAGLLSLLAAALALPLGTLLAWILVALVNTRSFGWSFPLVFSWGEIGGVLVQAGLAALGAGLLPWLLARRARIAELLESPA